MCSPLPLSGRHLFLRNVVEACAAGKLSGYAGRRVLSEHHQRVLIRYKNVRPSPCLRQSRPSGSAPLRFDRQLL